MTVDSALYTVKDKATSTYVVDVGPFDAFSAPKTFYAPSSDPSVQGIQTAQGTIDFKLGEGESAHLVLGDAKYPVAIAINSPQMGGVILKPTFYDQPPKIGYKVASFSALVNSLAANGITVNPEPLFSDSAVEKLKPTNGPYSSSITTVAGFTFTAKPAQIIWTNEANSAFVVVHSNGEFSRYNATGSYTYDYIFDGYKATDAKLKKAGFFKVAEGVQPKLEIIDYPSDKIMTVADMSEVVSELTSKSPDNLVFTVSGYPGDLLADAISSTSLDSESFGLSVEFWRLIIDELKKSDAFKLLKAPQKSKITKAAKSLHLLAVVHSLAVTGKAGKAFTDTQLADLEWVDAHNPNFYYVSAFVVEAKSNNAKFAWLSSNKEVPSNIFSASAEQLKQVVVDNILDKTLIEYMTPEQIKYWTYAHYKVPYEYAGMPNKLNTQTKIEAAAIAQASIAVISKLAPKSKAPKSVDQFAWNFVNGLLAADEKTVTEFLGASVKENIEYAAEIFTGLIWRPSAKQYVLFAPSSLRKGLSYGYNLYAKNTGTLETLGRNICVAIGAKIEEEAYSATTKNWVNAQGKVIKVPLGASVYDYSEHYSDGYYLIVPEKFSVGYVINPNGEYYTYDCPTDITLKVYTCPKVLDYALAVADGETFSAESLAAVDGAEKQAEWTLALTESSAAYYYKSNVKTLDSKYKVLTAVLHQLPVGIKQLALSSSIGADTKTLDAILWKFNYSHYPIVDDNIKMGKAVKDTAALELTPIQKSLGGMHTKQVYVDPIGDEWMGKFFSSDPNAKYRVDAEHYANVIGRLFGFKSPQTFVREIDGNYMYVQHIDPAVSNLSKHTPLTLTLDQLATTMQEHVLDWLIGNHDSYYGNLLAAPGKKTVFGIDKGQAFKHIHDDKLAVDYLPPENPIPVWYDQFYHFLRDGKISAEDANFIARRVMLKAYQVQSQYSERYETLVSAALEKRNFWPSAYPSRTAFIGACMTRKSNLLADFKKLYDELFEAAGIEWTFDVESFGKRIGDAYVQNNSEFADDVFNTNAYGKALFFNSRDFDECHIMMSPMHQKDGGITLLGFARIHSSADSKLLTWLQSKVNGKLAHGAKEKTTTKPGAELTFVMEFHNAIVNYAKTLATHAKDKQFNMDTINAAKEYAKSMADYLQKVLEHREAKPSKVYAKAALKFSTLEQQDAWVDAVEQKMSEFNLLEEAFSKKKSVQSAFPGQPNFEAITYSPSKDLGKPGEEDKERYSLPSGNIIVKTSDGGHYLSQDDPSAQHWISSQEYAALKSTGTKKTKKSVVKEEPEEFKESTEEVQASGKQLIVTHRAAAIHGGQLDFVTGKMIQKSTESTTMQTGYEYSVSYGDVTIHYRPFKEQGVAKSQQGLLQFESKNWLGEAEVIDDILDTLAIMGLDVTPADAESLELYYWRHYTETIAGFSDAKSGKAKAVLSKVSNTDSMTASQELEMLKAAWASAYSQALVDNACWRPQFTPQYGEIGGKPSWYRPDFSVAELRKLYGYNLPTHSVYGSGAELLKRIINIMRNAKILPTEERLRVLGYVFSGMSSSSDQGHGSSNYVFTRQNLTHFGSGAFIVRPDTSLRTTNYSFNSDNFGNYDSRKSSAYFDPHTAFSMSNSGNELMIRNDAPVFVYIASNAKQKADIISKLTNEGVSEIAGRPLEEWIYTLAEWGKVKKTKIDELWNSLEKEEAEGWC